MIRCGAIFLSILVGCTALMLGCARPLQAVRPSQSGSDFGRNRESTSIAGAGKTATSPATRTFRNVASTELVVPFYEGLLIRQPPVALQQAGLSRVQLAYPGPLSAPMVAWKSSGDTWTVAFATKLDALPAQLDISSNGKTLDISLSCEQPAGIRELKLGGSWESVVEAVRRRWTVKGSGVCLADRFDRIDFYVHQWISQKENPPLRVDWTVDQLQTAMRRTPRTTLVQVYGFDPAGIDLGGRYFWSDSAFDLSRQVLSANPRVSHLAWLNLRTFKYSIPRLGRDSPLTPQVLAMAKLFDGKIREDDNYAYKAIDMCLASEEWQASRIRELDRLMDRGFKVIQLDEFPIAPAWNIVACQAAGHLHRPGDAADEWAKSMALIKRLSERAKKRAVLLTCEEPSAALLPYISGYIDREFNDSFDLYWMRRRSTLIETIPLFSTMFGDLVTPYTDVIDGKPALQPPSTWLRTYKMVPGQSEVEAGVRSH